MVRRVYVEKKPGFAVRAKELKEELVSYLGLKELTGVRVLVRYDVENIDEETFGKALTTVFSVTSSPPAVNQPRNVPLSPLFRVGTGSVPIDLPRSTSSDVTVHVPPFASKRTL